MSNKLDISRTNDYNYMLDQLRIKYYYYTEATKSLKIKVDFCLEAIYQCISQTNEYSELDRLLRQKAFVQYVKKESNINFTLDQRSDTPVVKIKQKNKPILMNINNIKRAA